MSAQLQAQSLPSQGEMEADIRFLADDALMGRAVGTRGHDLATAYIETQFKLAGVQTVPDQTSYLQPIYFDRRSPAKSGSMQWGDSTWTHGAELVWMAGEESMVEAKTVFVGYGEVDSVAGIDDLAGKKVEGKIVFSYLGSRNSRGLREILQLSREKRERFKAAGAIALIEVYKLNIPWEYMKSFIMKESMSLAPDDAEMNTETPILYGWVKETANGWAEDGKGNMRLESSGNKNDRVAASNVIGWIPGTDTALQDEYMILSAHYDHVGVGGNGPDTIYNGARDNAIGTAGLLCAARHFAAHPPRRGILLLAVTAEEKGMLGSQYYARNPWLPLKQAVFNFNSDGGGYNDTSAISVIGYDRTGVEKDLESIAGKYQFRVIADPSPEQGLFDRSDNVSFAQQGIPCLNYSPGMTALDEEIMRYYHQPADGPESLDYVYLKRYYHAYLETIRQIADRDRKPFWVEGDKYEETGKSLYGLE